MKDLQVYNKKRSFTNTPEPTGKVYSKKDKQLQFIIQRHDASHLHYDFRLELNGVLKSWAIPKGPSLNPKDKRLAMMVEDHPIAYGKFEGEIPKGNYGAGTVQIWDKGTYEPEVKNGNAEKTLNEELKKGSIKFILHGDKLNGSFALVRLKSAKENSWLLIKHRDDYAVDEYNAEYEKIKPKVRQAKKNIELKEKPNSVRSGQHEKLTHFIKPMLTQLHDKPFDDENWVFEIKWDGYRAIADVSKKDLKLYSRNGLSFKELYPEVVTALGKLKDEVILDGEIVVMNKDNKPSFQKLQQHSEQSEFPLFYYVFDCLSYKGKDISRLTLLERKKIVEKVIPKNSIIKYSDHVVQTGIDFFNSVIKMNLEGMVAKRADSVYQPGKRNRDWMKIKNHNTQEAIIAGYTAPKGSRNYFGALVLAIRDGKNLKYIGHTGTGFTEALLKDLYAKVQPLIRDRSPFKTKVVLNGDVTWVEPKLVCEIKFTELTEEGILRQPVFMGLRIDKSAHETTTIDKPIKTSAKKIKKTSNTKALAAKAIKQKKGEGLVIENEKDKNIKIEGHTVHLTNLSKVYWPTEKITKGELIDYYNGVSKYILPYLKDRPQSLKRNPNGIIDKGFFHKDAGEAAPVWVKSKKIYSESSNKDIDYILCNSKATLLYLNNLGCIEINPWNSTIKHLDKPDYFIIDIDPSESNTFNQVIDVALGVKEVLDKAGAKSYCKTSGATGMHVYVPLHAAYTYDQIGDFAHLIALLTQDMLPNITTVERSLKKRGGKIYLDYLQNKRGQTLASVYSARPVEGATVSTPLLWKEVKHGLSPSDFTFSTVLKRLEKKGDLFKGVLTDKIDLKTSIKKLEALQ